MTDRLSKISKRGKTIEDVANSYIDEILAIRSRPKHGRPSKQAEHVRHTLSRFLPFVRSRGRKNIVALDTEDLSAFVGHCRTLRQANGKPYSDATIHGWAK